LDCFFEDYKTTKSIFDLLLSGKFSNEKRKRIVLTNIKIKAYFGTGYN